MACTLVAKQAEIKIQPQREVERESGRERQRGEKDREERKARQREAENRERGYECG